MSMSKGAEKDSARREPASERASSLPYIIGFVLSLCFTIIPYNMVTGHLAAGTVLLGVILAIAALQMVVQILFFLHLGRERKPRWQLYFFVGTIIGVLTVVVGSIFIMAHLNHNMNPMDMTEKLTQDEGIAQVEGTSTGACQVIHAEHQIAVTNGVANPIHTDAHRCDALIFMTGDDTSHVIAFGTRPELVPYAGQDDLPVSKEHSQMLILSQTGSYNFYDNLNPLTTGSFTVKP